jgi:transposase-like protein
MSKEVKGKKFGRLYLESFKQAVAAEAEREGNLALVCERHGISTKAIQDWMKIYGSISYHENKTKRRSLSEREGIAREIVSGHISISDAVLKYNVASRDTVTVWIRKYKLRQQDLLELLPAEQGSSEPDALLVNASRADLKLADLKIRALEMMLDIASKEFGVDIRKKFGAKP